MEITARVAQDAKTSVTPKGKTVINFSVVAHRRYKKKDAQDYTTESLFIDCTYWRSSAIAEYLTKGKIVTLTGWLGSEAWIDKTTGKARSKVTLRVDNILLHKDSTAPTNGAAATKKRGVKNKEEEAEPVDDLPF